MGHDLPWLETVARPRTVEAGNGTEHRGDK
jgi:hypothetical protein